MKLDWELLYNDESAYFPRLLQFAEISDTRFRYGVNEQLQHSLYFHFPQNPENRLFESLTMVNISFGEIILEGTQALVLTLLNPNLKNLFNDLILSLVVQTRQGDGAGTKAGFISLCNEWFELFDPLTSQLSRTDIQGIFAEVYFLKYLLTTSGASFSNLLSAWKGPFGKGHDFELGNQLFEVKSYSNSPLIHISSEYQLDYLPGQNLSLIVCEFSNQPNEGTTIAQLVKETAAILRSHFGINMSIYWSALGKIKLTHNNLNDYNDYLFNLKGISYYDCTYPEFPSIRRSNIPGAVRNVSYELAINILTPFELQDINAFI